MAIHQAENDKSSENVQWRQSEQRIPTGSKALEDWAARHSIHPNILTVFASFSITSINDLLQMEESQLFTVLASMKVITRKKCLGELQTMRLASCPPRPPLPYPLPFII
eukprot:scaffold1046_cov162-Ochromonas_danica.AAC.15